MKEKYELEEGQIVLCTVNKIIGTTVFVRIDNDGEGTLTFSEIAPGRIRNLREYVMPGKKIVCKILKIQGDRINLSLRRVKQQEKKELLDKLAKENSYKAILKTVLGDNYQTIINKITENYSLIDFFSELLSHKTELEKLIGKEHAERIIKILETKKEKAKEMKQLFKLHNKSENGIIIIKQILEEAKKGTSCSIKYIAAGRYSLINEGENFKQVKNQMNTVISIIEQQAKKRKCFFEMEKS